MRRTSGIFWLGFALAQSAVFAQPSRPEDPWQREYELVAQSAGTDPAPSSL